MHGFARANEFRNPVEIVAGKSGDGRFRDDDAGRIYGEVVAAVDETGKRIHDEAVALRGNNVENNCPARAVEITGPIVVRDDNFSILGVAASSNERAAMVRRGDGRRRR